MHYKTKRTNSDNDGKEKRMEKPTQIGKVPLDGSQEASKNGNEMELLAEKGTLTDRTELLESKTVELQRNIEKASLCQRPTFSAVFVRTKKSLECGRTGNII